MSGRLNPPSPAIMYVPDLDFVKREVSHRLRYAYTDSHPYSSCSKISPDPSVAACLETNRHDARDNPLVQYRYLKHHTCGPQATPSTP